MLKNRKFRLIAYPAVSAALSLVVTDRSWQFLEVIIKEVTAVEQPAPYQYRVLVPFALRPLGDLAGYHPAVFLFWFLCFALTLFLIDEIGEALGNGRNNRAVLYLAFIIIPALIYFHPAPAFGNGLEAVFMAAGLLLILRGRAWPLYPLVFVATFNRETALLIPLMYMAVSRDWKHGAGLAIVWAAVWGGLRLAIGNLPNDVTLAEVWALNTAVSGIFKFLLGLLFTGWLFWYSWQGWKVAPVGLRRAAAAVPVYLGFVLVFGAWHEWRLLLTVYPLLIPLAGFGMVNDES